jgi:hypothetical protein
MWPGVTGEAAGEELAAAEATAGTISADAAAIIDPTIPSRVVRSMPFSPDRSAIQSQRSAGSGQPRPNPKTIHAEAEDEQQSRALTVKHLDNLVSAHER